MGSTTKTIVSVENDALYIALIIITIILIDEDLADCVVFQGKGWGDHVLYPPTQCLADNLEHS